MKKERNIALAVCAVLAALILLLTSQSSPLYQSVFLNGKYSVVNPAQQAEITGESVIVMPDNGEISSMICKIRR